MPGGGIVAAMGGVEDEAATAGVAVAVCPLAVAWEISCISKLDSC